MKILKFIGECIFRFISLVICVLLAIEIFSYSFIIDDYGMDMMYHEDINVPGSVISKNIEEYAHGKHHRNMSTRYIMSVKPDDLETYKPYSVYVNYTTYSTFNSGNHVSFRMNESEVLRNPKKIPYWRFAAGITCFIIGLFIFVFGAFVGLYGLIILIIGKKAFVKPSNLEQLFDSITF